MLEKSSMYWYNSGSGKCKSRNFEIVASPRFKERADIKKNKVHAMAWNGEAYSNIEKSRHMWYVIQVTTGKEEQILKMIKRYGVQEYVKECFIPKYERRKKYLGQWHQEETILFPGYIFIISENAGGLYLALKQIPQLTKLLGVGEKWTPMTKEDIAIIEALSGEERLVKCSEGYIVGSKVTITSGPLMGMEAMIRKIDRHKRMAWMEIEIFGRKTDIQAGLEIIRKE